MAEGPMWVNDVFFGGPLVKIEIALWGIIERNYLIKERGGGCGVSHINNTVYLKLST